MPFVQAIQPFPAAAALFFAKPFRRPWDFTARFLTAGRVQRHRSIYDHNYNQSAVTCQSQPVSQYVPIVWVCQTYVAPSCKKPMSHQREIFIAAKRIGMAFSVADDSPGNAVLQNTYFLPAAALSKSNFSSAPTKWRTLFDRYPSAILVDCPFALC
jgi:hypothetical protein